MVYGCVRLKIPDFFVIEALPEKVFADGLNGRRVFRGSRAAGRTREQRSRCCGHNRCNKFLRRDKLWGGRLCCHTATQKYAEQQNEPFVHYRLQLRGDPFEVA
jgi:hypothetical protein